MEITASEDITMRTLIFSVLLFLPFISQAEVPEIGAGVSGPYIECELPNGNIEYMPVLICKNKGGQP